MEFGFGNTLQVEKCVYSNLCQIVYDLGEGLRKLKTKLSASVSSLSSVPNSSSLVKMTILISLTVLLFVSVSLDAKMEMCFWLML